MYKEMTTKKLIGRCHPFKIGSDQQEQRKIVYSQQTCIAFQNLLKQNKMTRYSSYTTLCDDSPSELKINNFFLCPRFVANVFCSSGMLLLVVVAGWSCWLCCVVCLLLILFCSASVSVGIGMITFSSRFYLVLPSDRDKLMAKHLSQLILCYQVPLHHFLILSPFSLVHSQELFIRFFDWQFGGIWGFRLLKVYFHFMFCNRSGFFERHQRMDRNESFFQNGNQNESWNLEHSCINKAAVTNSGRIVTVSRSF